jgi:hypothetical protein
MEVTKAMGTFCNYVNTPKQIHGLSKSKTLSFIFQKVLCLIMSYIYFGDFINATLISMKDGNFMSKSRRCLGKEDMW